MNIKALIHRSISNPWHWAAGILLGCVAAYVDLHVQSRRPYVLLLFLVSAVMGATEPRYTWRWALAVGLVLPVVVLITGYWGPYAYDRFDVFYGLVPALAGAFLGAFLGRRRPAVT
jgi:hypothetical protein